MTEPHEHTSDGGGGAEKRKRQDEEEVHESVSSGSLHPMISTAPQVCGEDPVSETTCEINTVVNYVKARRPRNVSVNEKLDILLLVAKFRQEQLSDSLNSTEGDPHDSCSMNKITERVAKLLHRKKQLVAEVWKDYCAGKEFSANRPGGNYGAKEANVPDTVEVHLAIAALVQRNSNNSMMAMNSTNTKFAARDVMQVLLEQELIQMNGKSEASILRSVQRFLKKKGYMNNSESTTASSPLEQQHVPPTLDDDNDHHLELEHDDVDAPPFFLSTT